MIETMYIEYYLVLYNSDVFILITKVSIYFLIYKY